MERSNGGGGVGLSGGLRGPVVRGGDGGTNYKMHAPSHPQAVNQYIKEYNYNKPQNDYGQALQAHLAAAAAGAARKYIIIATPVSVI